MSATFTKRDGTPLKNVSHRNLAYHTKDQPLLVRFEAAGENQYGPWAAFEVMGDMGNKYYYNPFDKGQDTSAWPQIKAKIEAAKGDFAAVVAQIEPDGTPFLMFEDQDGNPVLPESPLAPGGQVPVPQKAVQNAVDQLDGVTSDSYASLMAECIDAAEKAVQRAATNFGADDIRAMACTIFIQRHR